ncbi:leukocyte receptor cluster member 1 homolog isoform X2 [Mercenaria mercenaria]|uniref:leukocyte receptor cluster member 1 homolog isoform X2 n=1 Tax=Mercenaria mercenaria TaxID=6596 RepID=UPI00234EE12C|nr:leukocyte receptor cluster member 1 homolog isoform X2 [Mercenaria mercenaria]
MNILPQKSWHVRTRKNIERVRRDEAKAAEEEKEKQRRIALAEQEARTDLLRKRAKTRHGEDQIEHSTDKLPRIDDTASQTVEQGTSKSEVQYTGHINFFKDVEEGEVKQGKNAEHEEEKKAEKEKWEKDIGLLTYLGQSAVESKEKAPWYLSGRKREKEPLDPVEKDRKLKASLDPLNQMKSYVHKTKHKHKHEDKERHHKHKHKKKSKEKDSKKTEKHVSATKTIEQLRAERLNRERQERQKALDLISGGQGQKTKVTEETVNERDRGYNSMFNPDLARKPKHRHSYERRY